MKLKSTAVLATIIGVQIALAGCSTGSNPTPQTSASAAVIEQPTATPSPTESSFGKSFGEINEWTDKVSISVSAPAPFTPTEYHAGGTPGLESVYFKIVLTNNSAEPFQPFAYESVSSGGLTAKAIMDTGNELGDFGSVPNTAVLPGGTIEWVVGYSVADPSSVIFQIEPDPYHDAVVFTNVAR